MLFGLAKQISANAETAERSFLAQKDGEHLAQNNLSTIAYLFANQI